MIAKPENELQVEQALQLFPRLSESILQEERDAMRAANRLRRLPEAVVYFVYNAATDEEKSRVDHLVHRLRADAARLIRERVDTTGEKQRVRELIERGRNDLVFRPWSLDDLPQFLSMLDSETLWRYLPEDYPDPVTEDHARQLIELSGGLPDRHLVRAVQWQGQPIGQVRLQFDSSPHEDSAEISYWTGEAFWGKGCTAAAVARFTLESFQQRPEIERIFAQVLDGNDASVRVLEKAGYHRESFKHRNVVKRGNRVFSTRVLAAHRAEYVDY